MNAAEAHELALSHIQFAHDLGEAANTQGEFWISVSYAALVLAFVAPHVLNRITTPLVLALYTTYTISIGSNALFDLETAHASMEDAEKLLADHQIHLATFEEKIRAQRDEKLTGMQELGRLHAPGLFLATMGYIGFVSYGNWRGQRQKPSDSS